MTATSSVSTFHQWLLAGDPQPATDCSIVIHGVTPTMGRELAIRIAAHLNEYDDSSAPAWLDVSADMLAAIAADSNHRSLLGIADGCPNCPPTSPCGLKKTIIALAGRGRVILDAPLAAAATCGMDRVFHVGIGLPPAEGLEACHIVINPKRFPESCIPGVIGDVFLEWLNCPHRLKPALRGL
jgi:hypothetical protein